MNKTLLIISGGSEAIPGIQKAKEMGLYVVVSDGNKNAPGFEFADDRIIASTYDIELTVKKSKDYNNLRKIDGVMCMASDVPLTVASVAKELSIPGITIESAMLSSDKIAMKDKFFSDNVLIPKYKELFNIEDLKSIISNWKFPLIIKPVDSRGARGVARLDNNTNIDWAWSFAKENSPTGRVMVEEYLEGPQVSTESLVINGNCFTIGFSDRNYELLDEYFPFVIENGGDLPSFLSEEIQSKIKILVSEAAKSIGVKNGVVKGDIVVSKGKPYIIEIATRLSGGYFCSHEIPLNTGVDFLSNAIKISLGESIDLSELTVKNNTCVSQRYLFPKAGKTIKKINGINKIKKMNFVKFFDIRIEEGSVIPETTSHPSRAGLIIVTGTSRLNAISNAELAVKSIEFEYI